MKDCFSTHDVLNQSPPLEPLNLFTSNAALIEAIKREGAASAAQRLSAVGAVCGSAEAFQNGRLAEEFSPRLKTFDNKGRRRDVVEFHPAYHACMQISVAEGLHCSAWDHLAKPGIPPIAGANVARSAGTYMAIQMDAGHQCPITMTNASVPALLASPEIANAWLPKILSRTYDPSFQPIALKHGATIGMGMTEKQGGTDVRSNTTHAERVGAEASAEYLVTGHKWFMSAPMCDAFLVLAQAPRGLSCFLMPRVLPDGSTNALRFQRLKDKLGNRSNASSEVEFQNAHAWLLGEEGRGIATILEMVTCTRLDCAVGSAGLMRLAVASAIHHCRHRSVFQKRLVDQPMMTQVLADLALDSEAATALSFRLARSFDETADAQGAAWRRLMTPVAKYWVCKMGPALAYEAMECLGGNGYVEEGLLARIYRELPVNAIWEGSGNVMVLDVLRVIQREPEAVDHVLAGLDAACSGEARLETALARIRSLLGKPALLEQRGRELVENLAVLAAATLLRAHAPEAVSDAFISTRFGNARRQFYGQGLDEADTRAIIDRALTG